MKIKEENLLIDDKEYLTVNYKSKNIDITYYYEGSKEDESKKEEEDFDFDEEHKKEEPKKEKKSKSVEKADEE